MPGHLVIAFDSLDLVLCCVSAIYLLHGAVQ
jgi:hypothetical protein